MKSKTTTWREKLSNMAEQLTQHKLQAYYIPPEDEHLNEILPENKRRIEWLTGFTGEKAPLLVTAERMYLYVDGRFDIRVDKEIDPSVVSAVKLSQIPLTPSLSPNGGKGALTMPSSQMGKRVTQEKKGITSSNYVSETLASFIKEHNIRDTPLYVGYDPAIMSLNRLRDLKSAMPKDLNIKWVPVKGNLVDSVWSDRPPLPTKKAFLIGDGVTGKTTENKLIDVREEMKSLGADILPVIKLDEIAWLFNIRGCDVPHSPVLESYAILTLDKAYLFAPPQKVPGDLKRVLESQGISVRPYEDYQRVLKELVSNNNGSPGKLALLLDRNSMTGETFDIVKHHVKTVRKENPVELQKAIKNPIEIERLRTSNLRASDALIRHLAWVDRTFSKGVKLTEEDLKSDLEKRFREEPGFFDLSFPTIAALGANSADIHYSGPPPHPALSPNGGEGAIRAALSTNGGEGSIRDGRDGDFYLIDSGCQFDIGGTTDTTRTTVLGKPDKLQKKRYTAVLKGHIASADYCFKEGTTGIRIDAVCRRPLAQEGVDYAHGTGHGVGAFLNVHEGPQGISESSEAVKFQPGMVTSIEPGYYKEDWGGIRLENLYYVTEDTSKEPFKGKKWLKFEQLTFVPFEKKLIDFSELNSEELKWLRDYNEKILEKMSSTLSKEERVWLKEQCKVPSERSILLRKLFKTFSE